MPERFLMQFEKRAADECWPWKGFRTQSGSGYGQIKVDGKRWQAHRFSFVYHTGQTIGDGFEACHRCDNRACVNPNHIFLGTHLDNMLDMQSKGRRKYERGPRKTECKYGHPLIPENLFFNKDGHRGCIICRRARDRIRK
jgi:hypothetical protein